jgi:hypothetical protein
MIHVVMMKCLMTPFTILIGLALSIILGFCHDADEICALLGYYASSNGNPLPTVQDNVSVPSSRVKKSKKQFYSKKKFYLSGTS